MARVEWSRQSGSDVEAVLAILLCREHPDAVRVKPAQGDGGIDVIVPGPSGAVVFQIKGFTGNIDSGRKRQIESSWRTFREFQAEQGMPVAEWNLVVPENPTQPQLAWLQELTKGVGFPCSWKGLDFADGLAAKYPDVIDYYLRDSKERLQETLRGFLQILSPSVVDGSPAEVLTRLGKIHDSLNQVDPHYRYDFAVDHVEPGVMPPVRVHAPRLVFVCQLRNGQQCVTVHVFARFNEATKERPIPLHMKLVAEAGSPQEDQLHEWVKYGTPIEEISATDLRFDLPGGLGELVPAEGTIRLGPAKSPLAIAPEFTLLVVDEVGEAVESLDFVTREVSNGLDGSGHRGVCYDKVAGVVRLELRLHELDGTASIRIQTEDFIGKIPGDLVAAIRFLNACRPPYGLQVALRGGPPISSTWPIDHPVIGKQEGELWLRCCESLATIQTCLFERIMLPDLSKQTWEEVEQWWTVSTYLRGEAILGQWEESTLLLMEGVALPQEEQTAVLTLPLTATIAGKTHELGTVIYELRSFKVDPDHQPLMRDGAVDIRIVPGHDDSVVSRLARPDELAPGSPMASGR